MRAALADTALGRDSVCCAREDSKWSRPQGGLWFWPKPCAPPSVTLPAEFVHLTLCFCGGHALYLGLR